MPGPPVIRHVKWSLEYHHGSQDGHHAKSIGERINCHKMGLLNRQYRTGIECRSYQTHSSVHELVANQKNQDHGKQVRKSRELPSNQGNRVITNLPDPFAHIVDQEQGKSPVNKKGITVIVWVQRGGLIVKVFADVVNWLNTV